MVKPGIWQKRSKRYFEKITISAANAAITIPTAKQPATGLAKLRSQGNPGEPHPKLPIVIQDLSSLK